MPFQSKAQEGFLWANHPDIARRWQRESPVDIKSLPERKRATKKTKDLLSGTNRLKAKE